MNRYGILALLVFVLAVNMVAADNLSTTLSKMTEQLKGILPVVALLMIVLAGVVYAAGQVMGAEMRSRATVWAQTLLIGAIIGLLIAGLADPLVKLFSGQQLFTT